MPVLWHIAYVFVCTLCKYVYRSVSVSTYFLSIYLPSDTLKTADLAAHLIWKKSISNCTTIVFLLHLWPYICTWKLRWPCWQTHLFLIIQLKLILSYSESLCSLTHYLQEPQMWLTGSSWCYSIKISLESWKYLWKSQ